MILYKSLFKYTRSSPATPYKRISSFAIHLLVEILAKFPCFLPSFFLVVYADGARQKRTQIQWQTVPSQKDNLKEPFCITFEDSPKYGAI